MKRRTIIVGAIAIVCLFALTFEITNLLIIVPDNQRAIEHICESGNNTLRLVNEKNAALISVFDKSSAESGRPISPEVQVLYDLYRLPIPLTDCSIDKK